MKDLILADFSFKSYSKPIQIKKQSTNKEGCLLKKDKKKEEGDEKNKCRLSGDRVNQRTVR
jgi:hypothetical protein